MDKILDSKLPKDQESVVRPMTYLCLGPAWAGQVRSKPSSQPVLLLWLPPIWPISYPGQARAHRTKQCGG